MTTAVVWSCAHAMPEHSNERFDWLGKFLFDIKPDYVVDLGDFGDFKSLNSYDTRYPQAIVSQSYQADVEFYNDAQDRIRHQFRQSKKRMPFFYGFEGNHCVPEGTDILVKGRGWIQIEDASVGEEVMSLEGWQPIQEVLSFDHDGPMVRYGDNGAMSVTTEDHRLYFYNGSGNLTVTTAKDAPKNLDLPVSTTIGDGLDYTDDQLRFIGVALTDSYFGKNGKDLIFYQSGPKADRIEGIIKRAGVTYKKKTRNRGTTNICGKELKSVQVGYEFHMKVPDWCVLSNKFVPDEFFDLSKEQFEVLLEVLIFCDGSIPTKATSSRVFYGRKEICDDVQALAVTKGYRATLTEYRENHWRVNLCQTYKCRANRVEADNYNGKVWCLVVPTHNFLMRQANKPVFTGNCNRIKKALSLDPRLEGEKYGISFRHLQTDYWYDEYYNYENGGPAIREIDGVLYAHYFSSGNMGTAMSGDHHAYNLLRKFHQSATCGHSHKRNIYFKDDSYKRSIGLVAGNFKGGAETWAGQSQNGWWSGVVVKRAIDNGSYEPEWVSIERLKKVYG